MTNKKRIISISILSMIALGACMNQEPSQVEAESVTRLSVALKKLEGVSLGIMHLSNDLYFNPATSCIYNSDFVPIAEQLYSVNDNKCTGFYQQYIPK